MRLLVTGGAGYVGSVVSRHLLEAGHDIVVLDNLSTGFADAVPAGVELVERDILDASSVLSRRPGFDGVLHFAAKSLVSVEHPERYWHNNVVGSLALLDAMREHSVPRLVFSSTAAVYGEPDGCPIRETAPTRPTNAYGASKLTVDMMMTTESMAYGLAATSLRYFNVAGAGHGAGERHDPETHLVPVALQVVSGRREGLVIHGDDYPTPDGTCVRDYIHIDDLARGHLLALEHGVPGRHRIYNLGNGAGFSVREVIESVRRVTGHPVPVTIGPRRGGDTAELVASSQLAREELGWAPEKPDLDQIVADAWNFTLQCV